MKLSLCNFKDASGALSATKMQSIRQLVRATTFIETGTYLGDTLAAMRRVFEKAYSIELSEELYNRARQRFANDKNVTLLLGNSAEKLIELENVVNDGANIFWLDAHWSGGITARAGENTPLIKELRAIQRFELQKSVIMIDDVRYFFDVAEGFATHDANYGYPQLANLLSLVSTLWPSHIPIINGDVLIIFPSDVYAKIQVSDVLRATNLLRCGQIVKPDLDSLEETVACAQGDERIAIVQLPDVFMNSLTYGIGGDYLYWRGLVLERDGAIDLALADFTLARKSGVEIPRRAWE